MIDATYNPTSSASTEVPARPLPQVVWLMGDEPFFNDFCMDADVVMDRLQIKRSRLTQISGKQLRVGKKRVGRFIKPYYRECDVTEYAAWTRAPASHVKSQEVVDAAAAKLTQTIQEIKEQADLHSSPAQVETVVTELCHHLGSELTSVLVPRLVTLLERSHHHHAQLQRALSGAKDEISLGVREQAARLSQDLAKLAPLARDLEDMRIRLQSLQAMINELSVRVANSSRDAERAWQILDTRDSQFLKSQNFARTARGARARPPTKTEVSTEGVGREWGISAPMALKPRELNRWRP